MTQSGASSSLHATMAKSSGTPQAEASSPQMSHRCSERGEPTICTPPVELLQRGLGVYYDERDERDSCAPPQELRQDAFDNISETYDSRRRCLEDFRRRIACHTAESEKTGFKLLRLNDEPFLLAFLRSKRMDIDAAFTKYISFCKRLSEDDWLCDFDAELVHRLFASESFGILRASDASGRVVLSINWMAFIPIVEELGAERAEEILKAIFCILLTLCFIDIRTNIYGVVIVGDFRGYKIQVMKYLNFFQYKSLLDLCQRCLPLRTHAFYLYSEPFYMRALLGALSPFMKPSVRQNLVCCGDNLSQLHKMLPPSTLPTNLGGLLAPHQSDAQQWIQDVRRLYTTFREKSPAR